MPFSDIGMEPPAGFFPDREDYFAKQLPPPPVFKQFTGGNGIVFISKAQQLDPGVINYPSYMKIGGAPDAAPEVPPVTPPVVIPKAETVPGAIKVPDATAPGVQEVLPPGGGLEDLSANEVPAIQGMTNLDVTKAPLGTELITSLAIAPQATTAEKVPAGDTLISGKDDQAPPPDYWQMNVPSDYAFVPQLVPTEFAQEVGVDAKKKDALEEIEDLSPTARDERTEPKFTKVVRAGAGWTEVQTHKGDTIVRKGTRNWRNNNPGNIEYGPFARKQGAVGHDGRFAVFPTYDVGRKAQIAWIRRESDKTIAQAITKYAPPSENNTARYIREVAAALGVPKDTVISDLTDEQLEVMQQAMEQVEGQGRKKGTEIITTPPPKPTASLPFDPLLEELVVSYNAEFAVSPVQYAPGVTREDIRNSGRKVEDTPIAPQERSISVDKENRKFQREEEAKRKDLREMFVRRQKGEREIVGKRRWSDI